MDAVKKNLTSINFYNYEKYFNTKLKSQAKEIVENSFLNQTPQTKAFESFLSFSNDTNEFEYTLIIDIGGTFTKTALRQYKNNTEKWIYLFEVSNLSLEDIDLAENSFTAFCKILSNMVKQKLETIGVNFQKVNSLSIIWSNSIKCIKEKENYINAFVCDKHEYKKGEWFNKEIENDFDLGKSFIDAFNKRSFNIENIVINNDTPFTAKALKGSTAGVVSSTGLNATSMNDGQIFITEIGHCFLIPEDIATTVDKGSFNNAVTIEELTSGKFLPTLFNNYINFLSSEFNELSEINNLIQKGEETFRSRDLTLLIMDQEFFLERRKNPEVYNPKNLEILKNLSIEIYKRSAYFTALTCYASVSNQEENIKIALDSRLSREVPNYFDIVKEQLDILKENTDIELLSPLKTTNGKISVPMLGAANCFS